MSINSIMVHFKAIILSVLLVVAMLSCLHEQNKTTVIEHGLPTDINDYDSEIHRIVRYSIKEWDSLFLDNTIDIVSVETLSSDTFHWIGVYAIPCYRSFSDTLPGSYPLYYTIVDDKLVLLILDSFMLERNKQELKLINPQAYTKYKLCEGSFNHDPIVWFYCFVKDSLIFRYSGYYLPDSVRYHPY